MSLTYNKKVEVAFQKEDEYALDGQSKICNWLYNQLLDECIRDYKYNDNKKQLLSGRNLRDYGVSLKDNNPFLKTVFSSVLKEPAARLKKSYEGFFKNGRGYPKHRSWKRKWFSLVYDDPKAGWKLEQNGTAIDVSLGKIQNEDGSISSHTKHIKGKLKEVVSLEKGELFKVFTIVKQQNKFYAVFTIEKCSNEELEHKEKMTAYRKECNIIKKENRDKNKEELKELLPKQPVLKQEEKAIPKDCKWIALDPNHKNFFVGVDYQAKTVEFEKLAMIKYWDKIIDMLKSKRDKCQKAYRKKETKNGTKYTVHSPRWNRINHALEQAYNARREQIKSALYSIAHLLYEDYDLVMIGDYTPTNGTAPFDNMKRSMLNQEEIGEFRRVLEWVATKENKFYLKVNEYNTTKECCVCGHLEKKDPNVRQFTCCNCGTTIARDVNSAINIAKKAGYILDVKKYKKQLAKCSHNGTIRYGQKAKIVAA